jgi:xanthine dehydrogenase accessory factor
MTSLYHAIAEIEEHNETAALCTIIRSQGSTPRHTTSKMLVYPDGHILGTVGGGEVESRILAEALQVIHLGRSRLLSYNMADPSRGDPGVCGGQLEVFVEPILPKPVLLLIGAGHVGKAVAHLAKWLGFYVIVSDDRPEFSTPQAVPGADAYRTWRCLLPEVVKIPWTYIVLTTRHERGRGGLPPGGSPMLPGHHWLAGRWSLTRRRWLKVSRKMNKITRDRASRRS